MSTVDRLFSVIQLLRRRRGPTTAQAIADSLGVSVRTVYRDVQRLQRGGTPIASEAGVGYWLLSSYDLAPVQLTEEEHQALDIALKLLVRTGDCGLMRTAERLRQKLPKSRSALSDTLLTSTWSPAYTPTASPCAMREAIRDEIELELEYRDQHGDLSHRQVQPIALTYFIDVTVLVAWCHLREDFRHFRLDRIAALTQNGAQFRGKGPWLRARWQSAETFAQATAADQPALTTVM